MWGDSLEMCKGIVQWFSAQVLEKHLDLNSSSAIYLLSIWRLLYLPQFHHLQIGHNITYFTGKRNVPHR